MKVYRNTENNELYVIFHVKPMKVLGSHFEAQRLYGSSERQKIKEDDIGTKFQVVAEKHGNLPHLIA